MSSLIAACILETVQVFDRSMHVFAPPEFDNSRAVTDAAAMMTYAFNSDVDFETLAFAARVRDLVAFMLTTLPKEKAAAAAGSPATTTAAVTDAGEKDGAGFDKGRRTNFGASENIASSIWHSVSNEMVVVIATGSETGAAR